MKRLFVGIFSLLLAAAIAITGFYETKSICVQAEKEAKEILKELKNEDEKKSSQKIEQFLKNYKKRAPLLGVFLNQNDTEELSMLLYQLEKNTKQQNRNEIEKQLEMVIGYFQYIYESEIPNVQNIL